MNKEHKQRLRKAAPWIGFAIAIVAAFLLGGWLLGGAASVATEGAEHAHGADEDTIWTCSMHPQIRKNEPGQCPICGMDLIPVQNDSSDMEAGPARVSLSDNAKIRARIRTASVRRLGTGSVERRLLGRVDYDETTLRTVTAWTGGRIDRLLVRVTGQKVRRGQTIARLYSPEIYSAHQDLIAARQQLGHLSSATPGAREAGTAALQASRDRLRLLGVPASEVEAMERAEQPSNNVSIRTPFGGTVIERMATEGNYVTTGAGLYRVADLSKLWVQLDAYESDLPLLRVGQDVSLSVEALPSESFQGRVTFVDPVLNRRTRTARVRIEVSNRAQHLRPGMFAEATVHGSAEETEGHQPLVIPDTAPLFTGRRSVVYVEVPNTERPTYDARVVRLGTKMGDVYPVIGGLTEGERVVIHGAFTLDADLQIRGGAAMMTAPDDTDDGPYDEIVQTPDEYRPPLATLLDHYLALHAALAADKLEDAKAASLALTNTAAAISPPSGSPFHDAWMPVARHIAAHAAHVSHAATLDDVRTPFRDLSQQVATILRVFGNPTQGTLRLAFCPMALGGEGAEWVQESEHVENPYFGAAMHSCGEVHNTVAHGTYLPLQQSAPAPRQAAPAGGHQH